jgi:DNA topoisomerase-1
LSASAVDAARKYIVGKYGKDYVPSDVRRYKTRSKGAQEAHEAIRPTDVNQDSIAALQNDTNLDPSAKRLYGLIWARFVACQMASTVYDRTTVVVEALRDAQGKHYELRVSGQIVKFDGWRKVIPNAKTDEPIIPGVKMREKLDLIEVLSEQKFTKPPARFNEASLIKTLESLGIGRPSTYAPTISTIQLRNYVEKKEGRFYPTPIGLTTSDFLVKNFPETFDYEFTAKMEENLDKVAEGALDWHKDIAKFWEPFSKLLQDVEKNAERVQIPTQKLNEPCPRCELDEVPNAEKGELVIRVGRFGKFISCSMFPDCEYTDRYLEKIDLKCPKCEEDGLTLENQGDVVVKKTKKGRTFYGCSRYPECEYASWKKPVDPNKPQVEEDLD